MKIKPYQQAICLLTGKPEMQSSNKHFIAETLFKCMTFSTLLTLISKITIIFNVQFHCRHFNLILRCQFIVLHYTTKPSRKKEAEAENKTGIKTHDPPHKHNQILHFGDNGADIIRRVDNWLLIRNHIQVWQGFLQI